MTLRLHTFTACGQPATVVSNGIVVQIQPPVVVNAGPDKEILAGSSVTLEGTADGTYPVTWTPGAGPHLPGQQPAATPGRARGDDHLHPLGRDRGLRLFR
ncbi:MAG: hypothetical protein WKG07_02560 [Hymenobacter sp.]